MMKEEKKINMLKVALSITRTVFIVEALINNRCTKACDWDYKVQSKNPEQEWEAYDL